MIKRRLFSFIAFNIIGIIVVISSQTYVAQDIYSEPVNYAIWSPDGSKIGVASPDGLLSILDTQSLNPMVTIEAFTASPDGFAPRYDFAWSPDGTRIVTGAYDKLVRVWNAVNGELLATLMQDTEEVTSVDWSDDGALIAGTRAGEYGVEIWDAITYQKISGHPNASASIAFRPDASQFAMGVAGLIVVYNTSNGLDLFNLPPRPEGVYVVERDEFIGTVIWTPDSKYILGVRSNNTIEVWDVEARQFKYSFENPGLTFFSPVSMDFDTVSNTFSLVGLDGILETRELATGKLIEEIKVIDADQPSAFSPYGGRLAVIAAQAGRAVSETPPQIIIPIISIERVQGIARRCLTDTDNPSPVVTSVLNDVVSNSLTKLTLPAFVQSVKALPVDAIPAACSADLVAVAEAVIAGQ
jgi:WD40 repeat protein